MKHNQSLGKAGEEKACSFLQEQGYSILARNYRSPYGEIDIIAQVDDILCFVEVKTRFSSTFGAPRLAVDKRKQQHLIACANQYLQENGAEDLLIRFDVIECTSHGVQHFPDAFRIS